MISEAIRYACSYHLSFLIMNFLAAHRPYVRVLCHSVVANFGDVSLVTMSFFSLTKCNFIYISELFLSGSIIELRRVSGIHFDYGQFIDFRSSRARAPILKHNKIILASFSDSMLMQDGKMQQDITSILQPSLMLHLFHS
jgi:hypothetical protein